MKDFFFKPKKVWAMFGAIMSLVLPIAMTGFAASAAKIVGFLLFIPFIALWLIVLSFVNSKEN